jgi:glycerol-3-phosphate acyltransferase PlsX
VINAQGKTRYRIAVDAMGGDHAPAEIVSGAIDAAISGGVEVLLVGDPEAIGKNLPAHVPDTLQIIPSHGVITEDEHPLEALRSKPKASIIVAAGLVKAGKADAYVTMGSTGAAMAAGVVAIGNLEGIDRPALGGPFLGLAPRTILVDLGASIDSRPSQLVNYGVLGSVFSKVFLDIDNPSVALLSVGSEEGKGNRQVREASQLFRQSGLNFIGNVEGVDIPLGKADVVVCDGFVGNILMKFAEGMGMAVMEYLKARVPKGTEKMAEELLGELANLTNYVEHRGGGPLLGLNGVGIVGHGRSKAASVTAAIDSACIALDGNLVDLMRRELSRVHLNVLNVKDEQEK